MTLIGDMGILPVLNSPTVDEGETSENKTWTNISPYTVLFELATALPYFNPNINKKKRLVTLE